RDLRPEGLVGHGRDDRVLRLAVADGDDARAGVALARVVAAAVAAASGQHERRGQRERTEPHKSLTRCHVSSWVAVHPGPTDAVRSDAGASLRPVVSRPNVTAPRRW